MISCKIYEDVELDIPVLTDIKVLKTKLSKVNEISILSETENDGVIKFTYEISIWNKDTLERYPIPFKEFFHLDNKLNSYAKKYGLKYKTCYSHYLADNNYGAKDVYLTSCDKSIQNN